MFSARRSALFALLLCWSLSLTAGSEPDEPAGRAVLADPMQPPEYRQTKEASRPEAKPAVHFRLTSTVVAADRRSAVINGKTVREGDRIGNARVVAIRPALVRLRRGGRIETVRLLPVSVKRPVAGG